jgi:hypothetical protein
MKSVAGILALILAASSSIPYFKYERPLNNANANGQHYVVVDETIWEHALPSLQDLRLYSAAMELPYALTVEAGSYERDQKTLRILQPGRLAGKTQFLLDMSGVPEYDRVKLAIAAQNFVAHGRVEGQDDPHGNRWTVLGTTTIYDLSDEKLGRNNTLQIPSSTFKFLRVTVDGAVKPSDLEGATADALLAKKAIWRDVKSQMAQEEHGTESVFTFTVPKNVPVERVTFTVAPQQPNFSRDVQIHGDREVELGSGEITKIHLLRNGQKIDCEENSVSIRVAESGKYRVAIRNGDDAPLKITGARLQQYERRLYFDSDSGAQVRFYYGDEKLETPVYDYRKMFRKDPTASQLQFGAEILNSAYAGRPDDRPWSERHPSLLWAAIIAAVAVLGTVAFRALKSPVT